MGGCYLYCQNTSCGVYLGSLGGDSCSICGWSAGAEDHQISDFDRLEAENKALKAELKQAEDNAEQHEFRANRYSAELEALRSKVVVVPDRDAGGNYYEEGWNACLDELARLNVNTVSEGLLRFLYGIDSLEGKWFGDNTQPKFWWRKYLRPLFSESAMPDTGKEDGNG